MTKYALTLDHRGRSYFLMKGKADSAAVESRLTTKGRKSGVRFTPDKRRAMKFTSSAAAMRRWSRLVRLHNIRGWVVSPVELTPVRKNPRNNFARPRPYPSEVRAARARLLKKFKGTPRAKLLRAAWKKADRK